ncbi:unnamed protein product [Callosobruchus maculatus]|nr:unnamed protein product [Callosobruchus maculatus]
MKNFCEFKFKCLLTEEKLRPYIKKGQTDINLYTLLESDLLGNKEDKHICRFCKQNFAKIYTSPLKGWLKNGLQEVVKEHFPEIDIGAIKNSLICKSCIQNLSDFGQFTAAWSNNNFSGEWMKTPTKGDHSPEEKYSIVKAEKIDEQKLNNGLEVIKIDEQNIKRRAKWYSVAKKHKCTKCNYSNEHLSSLKIHEKIHDDVALYKCGYCSFQSKHKGAIYTHTKSHKDPSEVKMYKCGECDFQAKIKCHVISHQRLHQTNMLKCTQCSFQTKYREALKRHQILHKDAAEVRVFVCEICGYTAKRKHNLKGHMLKHKDQGVVMHKCSLCKFQTKYKEALSRHKRLIHTDDKVHQCPHCDYQAKIVSYLKKHLLQHKDPSELKLYKCSYCNIATKTISQRNSHMKIAHSPPKFQCAVCGHKTRGKNNLKNHILRNHPREQWSKSTF